MDLDDRDADSADAVGEDYGSMGIAARIHYNGIVSAIAAFARTMIFELGSIFILPLAFGLDGVWLAVDVADVLALIMSVILLAAFRSRYHY